MQGRRSGRRRTGAILSNKVVVLASPSSSAQRSNLRPGPGLTVLRHQGDAARVPRGGTGLLQRPDRGLRDGWRGPRHRRRRCLLHRRERHRGLPQHRRRRDREPETQAGDLGTSAPRRTRRQHGVATSEYHDGTQVQAISRIHRGETSYAQVSTDERVSTIDTNCATACCSPTTTSPTPASPTQRQGAARSRPRGIDPNHPTEISPDPIAGCSPAAGSAPGREIQRARHGAVVRLAHPAAGAATGARELPHGLSNPAEGQEPTVFTDKASEWTAGFNPADHGGSSFGRDQGRGRASGRLISATVDAAP